MCGVTCRPAVNNIIGVTRESSQDGTQIVPLTLRSWSLTAVHLATKLSLAVVSDVMTLYLISTLRVSMHNIYKQSFEEVSEE